MKQRTHLMVTTSWDDGHKLDMRLADLLKKYGLKGTFYISPKDREFAPKDRLNPRDIRQLARDFEVGAHTLTHPRLTTVSEREAYREIKQSKDALEKIIGKRVTSFCYPGGDYDDRHPSMVRRTGMRLARTVERFQFDYTNLLTVPTTIHAYRHWSDAWQIAKFARFRPLRTVTYLLDWSELGQALFDEALERGGIFHLWGHSWEIDRNGDWQRLEKLCQYISGRAGVRYVANRSLR